MNKTMETDLFWDQLHFLREIADSAHNGIVIVDTEGNIRLFNQAAREVLGIPQPSLIGNHIRSISEEAWRDMRRILKTGQSQVGKKITIGTSTIIANRTPILQANGIKGILSIFQDISEYESLSTELESFKQLSMQLDAIIESSYDGLYVTDGKAKTLRVNRAYERISGLERSQLIGQDMRDLVREGVFDKSVTLEVLRLRKPITIMQDIVGGNKVIVTGNPILDNKGEISLVVTNVRDITELNQLRVELEETRKISSRYLEELEAFKKLEFASKQFVAKSEPFRSILKQAIKVSVVDTTVLITGESGVGKGLLARLIHRLSPRKDGPFVKISCGAIPESLIESELFGYERGAFTGARTEGKAGLLEMADGGTLFLDEIGELPLNLQVKLLDFLEERMVTRLGSTRSRKVDLRLVAATNQDLEQMVEEKEFREDLYFRLSVVPLRIPPLRERKDAIIPLVDHFLEKTVKKIGKKKIISPEVYEILLTFPFYGNVRELKNLVERMAVLSDAPVIDLSELPPHVRKQRSLLFFGDRSEPLPLKKALANLEEELIREAISKSGTFSNAARVLGVNQSTISRKVRKYKIT